MGYLKLNFASQSLRLSSSILPSPCRKIVLSSAHSRWQAVVPIAPNGRTLCRIPHTLALS